MPKGPQLRKCLYCSIIKATSEFNREHVIPESFGTFGSKTPTLNCVCRACNTDYFGKHLEPKLARDSIEGVLRFTSGLLNVEKYRHLGERATLRVELTDGWFAGAVAYLCKSIDGRRLDLNPAPQVGFARNANSPVSWFRLDRDELPAREVLKERFGTSPQIKMWGVNPSDARPALEARGATLGEVTSGPTLAAGQTVPTNIVATIERTHLRCIAKIAFNYFAKQLEPIAFLPDHDRIRRFVRYDEGDGLVRYEPEPMVEPNAELGGHAVGIQWAPQERFCWVQVTLFNIAHYTVLMGPRGPPLPVPATFGQYFDPAAKSVTRIQPIGPTTKAWRFVNTTRDSSRSRSTE